MNVFTISMGQWRMARQYGVSMVDTTVKTGVSIFKPSWDLVLGVKNHRITEAEYIQGYRQLMNASWKEHRAEWLEFIALEEPLALGCFCTAKNAEEHGLLHPDGTFLCHRFLLKDILEKLCHAKGIPFLYYGELSP